MTARRSALPYELIEPGDGRRARIRFTGLFQGRQVVWDAEVVSLAGSARQQFIEVGRHTRYGLSLTVGLHTPVIDEPVLRKTVIMIRQYKRLGHTRHEFGDTAGPAPAEAPVRPAKLLSGGQTGVDRAALDAALALGIPCGGWCPQGRRAEDGQIPARYPLTETGSPGYRERTYLNVRDSDGTLILARGALSGGTTLTRRVARALGKPCLVLDLAKAPDPRSVRAWMHNHDIRLLNVAGPRESQRPGIYRQAKRFLLRLFTGAGARGAKIHKRGD